MGTHMNWPPDFVDLKKLEDILQCSICYEYIDTCMITSCSHNFCSLCIRKYLQFKTQCPTCFEETHGSDLRKNRLVDDVISIWVALKDLLLFNVRLASMTQSVKAETKLCNGADTPETKVKKESKSTKKELVTPKTEKKKNRVAQNLFSEKKTTPESAEPKIVVDGVVIPSIFQPQQKSPKKNLMKKPEDMSACPVCEVDVPLKNLNMHLDSCLAASDPAPSRSKPKPEKRDPIPKRVYALMKEKDLKKCLKDYGLSAHGDRKAMIARISRYVVLYNAECDKELPRPVSEILKQVEREERDEKATQSNPLFQSARPPTLPPDKKKDPEAIEKANKEYLEQNKDNFRKLIENMRARDGKNIKPLKPLNRIDSDDESDGEMPSTSGIVKEDEPITIYSQDTVACSSDDDTDKSPVKSEPGTSRIDWDRTEVKTEGELDIADNEEPAEETKSLMEVNNPEDDESNSYDSVFNTSTVSESAMTPKSRLSLSARKRNKTTPVRPADSPSTSKIAEKFEEIFEADSEEAESNLDTSMPKIVENGQVEEGEKSEEDSEESSEEEDDSSEDEKDDLFSPSALGTPTKNYDVSPEISPMKTRSTKKRKSQTLEEKTTSGTRVTRSKRVKSSASPVY